MKTQRKYEIDWLRIILILSVFLFHVGMIFNSWDWHIKNDQQYPGLRWIMAFLHYWRMPMLFFISGIGTYYALGKRKIGQYLFERHNRLLVPLFFGIFLLVPIQVYIERIDQYPSIFNFYLHMFEGTYPKGNFSWHHLWFLVYLFTCSLFAVPFILFYKSKHSRRFKIFIDKLVKTRFGLAYFAIPILISQMILRPFFPEETHAFVDDWAFLTQDFLYFIFGFILFSNGNLSIQFYKQRHRMMILAGTFTAFMFLSLLIKSDIKWDIWSVNSILFSWFLVCSIIGYSQSFLRKDNIFRKIGNEMIYPFYLLHQPVIIFLGYFIIQFQIHDFMKFLVVLISSFIFTIAIYFLVIRNNKYLRIIFGVKKVIPIDFKKSVNRRLSKDYQLKNVS